MGILGDVNDGWFAQLAHGVENGGRWVGNLVTGGSGGDTFYNNMGNQANTVVSNINQNAINAATANGATPHQALNAGSNAMEPLINPTVSDLPNLVATGGQVATNTVAETVGNALAPDFSSLLIGGAIAGGAILLGNLMSPRTPAVSHGRASLSY